MHLRVAVASLLATGALVLLATSSDAQTISTAVASVNGSNDGKSRASADESPPRDGPTERRSRISRRACSSRRCRNSRATG